MDNIVDEKALTNDYVTAEKNYVYADSRQFFLPRSSATGYIETGYVSGYVSDANGDFATNPTITLQWEASYTFFNLDILFGDVKPSALIIRTYNYGTLVDTITDNDIQFDELIEWDFYDIDKLVIEFTKASPYNRIHVNKIRFGKRSDYSIDYRDMAKSPTAVTSDFIRKVNVNYYEYAYGAERKKLGTTKAVIGENTVTFSKPAHDYSIAFASGSGTLTITSTAAYCITFTSSKAADVDISGIEYVVTEKTVTGEVHQIGVDKTASNVLIDNSARAEAELAWISEYFANDIDYTINYRGEPAIDADDEIYIENKYVERNLVRVVSTQIDTSTGMSMNCKLKARRISYIEPALVDVAIVDESEVYG
jgi:hypothetical protein